MRPRHVLLTGLPHSCSPLLQCLVRAAPRAPAAASRRLRAAHHRNGRWAGLCFRLAAKPGDDIACRVQMPAGPIFLGIIHRAHTLSAALPRRPAAIARQSRGQPSRGAQPCLCARRASRQGSSGRRLRVQQSAGGFLRRVALPRLPGGQQAIGLSGDCVGGSRLYGCQIAGWLCCIDAHAAELL